MVAVVSSVVQEVLGHRALDVDKPIIEYIINVLADDDFDFGLDGDGAFDAIGELLVDSGCVDDDDESRSVCSKLSEKFGKHGLVKPKEAVRSLATPLRMFDGMDEDEAPKKQPELLEGPLLSERDKQKLERRKRKDERQREAQFQMHLAEMEAVKAGMPTVRVNHDGSDSGSAVRDIHMENFTISVGGRDLIQDCTVTLSFGRHYGLVGRNGTGKTSFLRHMAMHAIDGIPKNCQILHVEQEVVGDDTTAVQCVLSSDVERTQLLEEEARLLSHQRDLEYDEEVGKSNGQLSGGIDKDAIGKRLEQIYKRLEYIDADSAESRAASILAGLSFTPEMQKKATRAFSGGWRMRIALARALFIEPDLLLLDEPTNHLDLHAVLWLETYLVKWPKTFIVVSHAREFLNTVTTDILHLHGQKLTAYKGDYDTFERTREEQLKNQQNSPDIKTFNILLDSYGKAGRYEKMSSVMEYMQKYYFSWTLVTYNVVIDAFGRAGDLKQMEYLFRLMKSERIKPNCITLCSLVRAYGRAEAVDKINGVLRFIENSDVMLDTVFFNCLVDAYGRAGCLAEMREVLDMMKTRGCIPDKITYNTMIKAYLSRGINDRHVQDLRIANREETVLSQKT